MAKLQRLWLLCGELYVDSSPYSCPSNHDPQVSPTQPKPGFQRALLKTSFYSPVIASFRKRELPSVCFLSEKTCFPKMMDNAREQSKMEKRIWNFKRTEDQLMQCSILAAVRCICLFWVFFPRWVCLFSLEVKEQAPIVMKTSSFWKVWVGRRDDRILHEREWVSLWKPDHPLGWAPVHLPGCLTLHLNIVDPESCLQLFEKGLFRYWSDETIISIEKRKSESPGRGCIS